MIKKYTYKKNNYKSLIKVIFPSLLFLVMIFSLFFVSNNSKVITSLAKVFYGDNEIELDNWEISTVFYDSSVNNGNTPLTEINWDASNGGYDRGTSRRITVQINYKNTNSIQNYNLNDIKIRIPNILFSQDNNNIESSINISANDNTHSGYDWNVKMMNKYGNIASNIFTTQYYLFTNNVIFSERSNYEGSIQIIYVITPTAEKDSTQNSIGTIEFTDTCEHTINEEIHATLYSTNENDSINSNTINFSYYREYIHPWHKSQISLTKTANKIRAMDHLENYSDYTWVNYEFNAKDSKKSGIIKTSHETMPYYERGLLVKESTATLKEVIPKNCIVYDLNGHVIEPTYTNDTESTYIIPVKPINGYNSTYNLSNKIGSIIVGYPKTEFNEQNNNLLINNEVQLYGAYQTEDNIELIASSNTNVNLNNFSFGYSGSLYSLRKIENDTTKMKYQDIINNSVQASSSWTLYASAKYTGKKMRVKIGDDLLYSTASDGSITKLNDNDYYFSNIYFYNPENGYGQRLETEKYDCELWVRYAGENDYIKYDSFKNKSNSWSLSELENKVVGYYIIINDLKESINEDYNIIRTSTRFIKEDIPLEGDLYNFGYLQVYLEENDNYFLVNEPTVESYNNLFTYDNIAAYDLETYGSYLQRSVANSSWEYYTVHNIDSMMKVRKSASETVQNPSEEKYTGSFSISADFLTHYTLNATYAEQYGEKDAVKGFVLYDLVPEGIKVTSTSEDILNSEYLDTFSGKLYSPYTKTIINDSDYLEVAKRNTIVNVYNNWKGTGRTLIKISVDLSEFPVIFSTYIPDKHATAFRYNYEISYNNYLELGSTYTNNCYGEFLHKQEGQSYYTNGSSNLNYMTLDDGSLDSDAIDINENGISDEYLAVEKDTAILRNAVATYQDVQVSVQSDLSNFDTGKVETSNDSEYTYKLRARTGTNDVTNLVIYDSLENYAKDPNMEFIEASKGYHKWKGEFLGIDTSYAESKGYTIRTYYSESDQPGSLKDDNSWQLYTNSVDKTKVKSIAFEYLDENNNSAVLPANSLTYVLIRMKSPNDENLKTLAYNGCWTEWNAIDSVTGRPVDFITGINSNIVKVALPNSVEPIDIDLEINKYWKDNNSMNLRPNTINIQVVPDGDITKAIDVPLGTTNIDPNNSNHWKTTISVPKYDLDGNTIAYTLREEETILDNGYKYTPEVNDNSITNTLMKEIELKKIWKDNNNSYLTRPSNVTYKIKQNNSLYQEVTFTGDYSTNEWTKTITVPVYDDSNREYNYSIEEVNVNNYTSSCENYTCTNTLSGNDTLNIKKNWVDNNNSYNTRPSSIMVNVLQNNTTYRGISLTNNNNWTNAITVPKYDSNGVKYNYTIEENQIEEYGLVEYNQNNYNITNTLKTNISLTITKNWIDDNNSNNTRPDELKITLLQNDNEYRELTLTGNTNTWTTTIEVPKYDNNQRKCSYSIREITDNLNSDYSDITYSEEELSVTNKLNKKQDLIIKKKWLDQDNKYLTRPSNVSINVLKDGEVYRTIELSGDSNIWTYTINDVDVYDSNGRKYIYTIEETVSLDKYKNITYDQTNLEVTNELTEVPTVTLYFTVVNGYIDPKTGEMRYDDFGLNEIMKQYNVNPEDEYIFKFELQNTTSGKLYEGKLSTKGILEFDDLPYGEYKAVEGEDKLFKFVDMLEIEEVNGVKFEKRGKEGYITIEPTGQNIIYGAKIINKIEAPITNPKTSAKGLFLLLTILIITLISFIFIKKKKELYN